MQKQGEFELIAAELAGSYQQVPQFSLGWRIADQKIFNFLEKSNKVFMQNHKKNIDKIIKECIKIKIDTVEKDFKENDLRSILNFGHTIGHALEKKYSYIESIK